MNRLILKYAYPITFIIWAILAWVVYRIFSAGERAHWVRRRDRHRQGTRHGLMSMYVNADANPRRNREIA